MTLEQKVLDLISRWHGSDAAERSELRQKLVSDLIMLIRQEAEGRSQGPGTRGQVGVR